MAIEKKQETRFSRSDQEIQLMNTVLFFLSGIRRPAWHPLPGDLCEERDQRGAGVHDDGGRDQEPRGAARAHRRRGRPGRQDRLQAGRQQAELGLLLGWRQIPGTVVSSSEKPRHMMMKREREK